jgi:hypothetical protein
MPHRIGAGSLAATSAGVMNLLRLKDLFQI